MLMLHESLHDYDVAKGSRVQRKRRDLPSHQFWDGFYQRHCRSFFKDRHYLSREFPLLMTGSPKILELGCGVGNTTLPLSEENTSAFIHCCDYSSVAITLLKADSRYNEARMRAFVADITQAGSLASQVPAGSLDVATAIFVLSANSPASLLQAAKELRKVLRPETGTVVVRDYAAGDLAEQRLCAQGSHRMLSQHLYSRGDGTLCLFFTEDSLCTPFLQAGFVCRDVHTRVRTVVNRKSGATMQRRFVQAVFCLPPGPPASCLHVHARCQEARASSASEDEDTTGASEQGKSYEEGLQCLRVAAEISCWTERSEGPTCHLPGRAEQMHRESERQLAEWFHDMPDMLRGRVVVDLGSGSSGICALAALASCAKYVVAPTSLELINSIQAHIRPSSHLFVCERLRFATKETLATDPLLVALLTSKPAVIIVRLGKDIAPRSEVAILQSCAAAELLQGSLLVCIGVGMCAPLDVDSQQMPEQSGLNWLPVHRSGSLEVLKLSEDLQIRMDKSRSKR